MKAFKLGIVMLFHPVVAFRHMQSDRDHFSYTPIWVILLAAVAVRIFSIYFTHYPMSAVDSKNGNLFMECVNIFVPMLSWVVASYAMTTILEGEVLLRESLLAMAYSLLPNILLNVPLVFFSHVMENGQQGLFAAVQTISFLWVIALLVINLKVMNHFTVKKTLAIILLSLFTMVIMWAATALFSALTMRFFSFVKEVATEIRYKLIY